MKKEVLPQRDEEPIENLRKIKPPQQETDAPPYPFARLV